MGMGAASRAASHRATGHGKGGLTAPAGRLNPTSGAAGVAAGVTAVDHQSNDAWGASGVGSLCRINRANPWRRSADTPVQGDMRCVAASIRDGEATIAAVRGVCGSEPLL